MTDSSSSHTRGTAATPRSRGAVTGSLLLALGVWGALIPYVGPYFHYAYTPDTHWTMTSARFFLEILPGAATFIGGVLLLTSGNRFSASFGGWLAVAGGAWVIVGPLLAPLFRTNYLGTPVGDKVHVSVEQIGFFYGLGGAILLLSAFALGRFSVVSVRDVALARQRADQRSHQDNPVPREETGTREHVLTREENEARATRADTTRE